MAGLIPNRAVPVVVGVDHRTASLTLRDRLFIEDADVGAVLSILKRAGVESAVVLSTCDRVEIIATGEESPAVEAAALSALRDRAAIEEGALGEAIYVHTGEDALRHLFRVAASLESQVVGEPQVLGQVKAAHRIARLGGFVSADLEAYMQAAYSTAKRIREETAIGEGPVSMAAVAAQAARDVHGDLTDRRALLIGDGDLGGMIVRQLLDRNLGTVTVAHPNEHRGHAIAGPLGAHTIPFGGLAGEIDVADIVVCALGRRGFSVTADMVRRTLGFRRRQPMLLLDLSVPGDVDPAVERLEDAYLFDLADLDALATDGASFRESEIPKAAAIVEQALDDMSRSSTERAAVPLLTHLRRHVEDIRDDALRDAGDDAEKATRLMASRLLHAPSVRLRELSRTAPSETLGNAEALLRRLFGLDDGHATNGDEKSGDET